MNRGKIDVDTLLKIAIILVVVWLALEIVGEVLGLFGALLGPLQPLLGIALLILLVLYVTDRI